MFSWFRNFSINAKLVWSFLIMIGGFMIACWCAYSAIETNNEHTKMALKSRDLAEKMTSARQDISKIIIRHYVHNLSSTSDDEDKKDITDSTQDVYNLIAELKQMAASDPDAMHMLADPTTGLEARVKDYAGTRDTEQLPAIFRNEIEKAGQISVSTQSQRFTDIIESAHKLAEHFSVQAKESGDAATRLFLIIGVLMVVLSVILYTILSESIARPLADLRIAAEKLAIGDINVSVGSSDSHDEVGALMRAFSSLGQSWRKIAVSAKQIAEGDLGLRLTPRSEVDVFTESFNVLVESMSVITQEFREAVQIVSTTASEILVSVNESAVGATETATAANQTSAIVEQVRQTSHVASQKAKQVSDSAQKTAQITAAGRKATEDIIEGMNRIREQVDLIAEAMVRLSEKSQSISGIIATVDDLAKQSNLLAVNASIEAARAGELGRGFGVVAQEVKNMAEQSKQSTAQVRAIIAEIQQATNAAAMATELGGKAVDAALQQSGRAGESIAVLAGSVLESAQAAAQIAVSNQQQLAGVDQVATAMASIRDACEEHIVAIKHVEVAATRLNDIGVRLKGLVDRYDVWSGTEYGSEQESLSGDGDESEEAAVSMR